MRKTTYITVVLFTFIATILFGKDEILWDLGLIISHENNSFSTPLPIEKKGIKVTLPDHVIQSKVNVLSKKLNINSERNEEHQLQKEDFPAKQEQAEDISTKSLLYGKDEIIAESLQKKGSDSFRSGRYKDALEYLKKIDYNNFTQEEQNQITYLKANALFHLGEYNKAEQQLKPLVSQRFSQNADDALMLLGMIYKKQHNQEKAITIFKQIVLDFPDSEFYESARIQTRILSQNK